MTSEKLPRRQQQLYELLVGRGEVSIPTLWERMNPGDLASVAVSQRLAQQRLGPIITRANRRLAKRGLRIQPGRLKGHYRLDVVE